MSMNGWRPTNEPWFLRQALPSPQHLRLPGFCSALPPTSDLQPVAENSAPPALVAESGKREEPILTKRAKLKKRVDGGAPITVENIPKLGKHALCEYLRAMGVKVGRDMAKDRPRMCEAAQSFLRERGVMSWSIEDQMSESSSKRHKP